MNTKFFYQRAFTIIELLIAMTIGLLVSLAAVNLFITNQVSYNVQKGLGDVGDNGRFALEFLAQEIRPAGYFPPPSLNLGLPQVVVAATDIPNGVASIVSVDDVAALPAPAGVYKQGGIDKSDSLTMQYYTPIATRDCEGDVVPAKTFKLMRLFLRADTVAGTGSALACEGGYHAGPSDSVLTNFNLANTGGTVLISTVDNFQVLIGLADTAVGANSRPTQYVTIQAYNTLVANSVAAGSPRPLVSAIKLGLMVSSIDKAGNNAVAPTVAVNVLNKSIAASSIPNDQRIRRVFSNTVTFRNVL